jgi:hypothetical protein
MPATLSANSAMGMELRLAAFTKEPVAGRGNDTLATTFESVVDGSWSINSALAT